MVSCKGLGWSRGHLNTMQKSAEGIVVFPGSEQAPNSVGSGHSEDEGLNGARKGYKEKVIRTHIS